MARKILFAAGIVSAVWWLALQFLGRHDTPFNYLYNAVYAVPPLIGAWFGFRIAAPAWGGRRSVVGRAVILFSVGALANAAAQLTWAFYNLVLKIEAPSPSLADIAWYLMNASMIASIIIFLAVTPRRRARAALAAALSALGVSLLFLWLARPFLAHKDFATFAVNAGYLVGDAVFISLILVALTLWKGRLSLFLKYAIASFAVLVAADSLFLTRLELDVYWNGDVSDLLYAVSGFLQALAITSVLPHSPSAPKPRHEI